MREEYDYTIVALEQTTNSKPLTHYDMPAKTLLLLGYNFTIEDNDFFCCFKQLSAILFLG